MGTVIKMFVVMYDLTDMPPNSHTFLRQRTLYMPTGTEVLDDLPDSEMTQKWLRYLIHLRYVNKDCFDFAFSVYLCVCARSLSD